MHKYARMILDAGGVRLQETRKHYVFRLGDVTIILHRGTRQHPRTAATVRAAILKSQRAGVA